MGNFRAYPDERVEEYVTWWSSSLSVYAKLSLNLQSKDKREIVLREINTNAVL